MIRHLTILDFNGHPRYLCNQVCTVTIKKIAANSKIVNCKNCLQIMKLINTGKEMQEYIRGKK